MKKRLLSLLLCVLMLLSTFVMASCGDDEGTLEKLSGSDDESATTSNNSAMTICLYSIRGEGMTDEAIALVEEALNRISVKKYNTKIDLILIEEDEYAAMMFPKIQTAIAAYNSSLMKNKNELTATEIAEIQAAMVDYRYKDANGNQQSYGLKENTNFSSNPEVLGGTLDIFLCYTPVNEYGEPDNSLLYSGTPVLNETGKPMSMFEILYNEKALAPLKSNLNGMYSDLKSVLYTHALSYVERATYDNASTTDYYGVPNNYIYGSYDYTIFNENYVDQFISPNGNGADKSAFHPVSDASKAKFNTLCSELLKAQSAGSIDADVLIPADWQSIQEFDSYESFQIFVNGGGYDFNGDGQITEDEKTYKDFAVAKIKGSKAVGELLKENSTTYAIYDRYTEVKENDYCESMFCIGINNMGTDKSGERVKRCLDILKLINTNKEFRNILQYGVEGTHYSQYSENEDVNPLKSARIDSQYYGLNPKYFGNMFLLYTSTDMTEAEKLMAKDNWLMAKEQIIEVVPWRDES